MRLLLIIGGFFLIIFTGLIPLKYNLAQFEVQKKGDIITAIIIYVPECYGIKTHPLMYLRYNNKSYSKKVWCGFSDSHKKGDVIKLKHIDETDIFLFEDEKIEKQFISTFVLILLGLIFIVMGFRRK